MTPRKNRSEIGFTILETSVVLLLAGIVIAIATPKITNAMREFRANIALRQMVDTLNRTKMQAISENKRSAMIVDIANSKAGMATLKYDVPTSSWIVDQIYYTPLPQGVTFQRPTAGPTGVTTLGVTSFPAYGTSTTIFRQDFTSRGFPIVAAGTDVGSIFLGNGQSYRCLTLTSTGGLRTYKTDTLTGSWIDTRS